MALQVRGQLVATESRTSKPSKYLSCTIYDRQWGEMTLVNCRLYLKFTGRVVSSDKEVAGNKAGSLNSLKHVSRAARNARFRCQSSPLIFCGQSLRVRRGDDPLKQAHITENCLAKKATANVFL